MYLISTFNIGTQSTPPKRRWASLTDLTDMPAKGVSDVDHTSVPREGSYPFFKDSQTLKAKSALAQTTDYPKEITPPAKPGSACEAGEARLSRRSLRMIDSQKMILGTPGD